MAQLARVFETMSELMALQHAVGEAAARAAAKKHTKGAPPASSAASNLMSVSEMCNVDPSWDYASRVSMMPLLGAAEESALAQTTTEARTLIAQMTSEMRSKKLASAERYIQLLLRANCAMQDLLDYARAIQSKELDHVRANCAIQMMAIGVTPQSERSMQVGSDAADDDDAPMELPQGYASGPATPMSAAPSPF